MTEAEAIEFMARTVVVYTEDGDTQNAFQEADQSNVLAGPGGQSHFISADDVIEALTVQQIATIAAGG